MRVNTRSTRSSARGAGIGSLIASAGSPSGAPAATQAFTRSISASSSQRAIDAIRAGADDSVGTADDWTNLIAQYQGTYAYSYTFDGQAGYLDHALANASVVGQVTGAADWHINSDEPDLLDYDTSFKAVAQDAIYEPNAYRSSDHDPVKVGLELNAPPTIAVVGGGACSGAPEVVRTPMKKA